MRVNFSAVQNNTQNTKTKQKVAFGDLYINTTKKALKEIDILQKTFNESNNSQVTELMKKNTVLDVLWKGLKNRQKYEKGSPAKTIITTEGTKIKATITQEDVQRAKISLKNSTPYEYTTNEHFSSSTDVFNFFNRVDDELAKFHK